MWLAIKDLYTDVKAQVLYSGELSREFDVSQGTGQGRIFAPFMYKVERCQQWFLKTFFMCLNLHRASFFSKFRILTQLSLKLLFLGRLITEPNLSAVVIGLFHSRAASFF